VTSSEDPFNLARFVVAQQHEYAEILKELKAGRKIGHWMWYVFPQLRGLGRSSTSQFYGISSRDEACAFWGHPVLGARLQECTRAILDVESRTAQEIFGHIDSLKFRSCLTLFKLSVPEAGIFAEALQKYFGGVADPLTIREMV
jgi:uncharacterized protein (DUF1810 family)